MRTSSKLTLLEVMDKKVLAGPRGWNGDKPFMFVLNSTAAFLWENLEGREFDTKDMVKLLMNEYDIPEEIAAPDVQFILDKWLSEGVVTSAL